MFIHHWFRVYGRLLWEEVNCRLREVGVLTCSGGGDKGSGDKGGGGLSSIAFAGVMSS